MVDAQHYGLLIDTVFQGLWLMPLGYLAYKSGLFPKALGVLLVVGSVCYLLDVLAQFLAPDFGPRIATVRRRPVSNRGNLDGRIPARDRREDRQARRAHPRRGGRGGGLTPSPTLPHTNGGPSPGRRLMRRFG
jgi:hypothetical protein